jgi:ABC-type transport system involved in multi-copper enzyme maturation permease subunit
MSDLVPPRAQTTTPHLAPPRIAPRAGLAQAPTLPQAAWLVAWRDMRDLVGDWRIIGPALLLIVVFPLLMVVMSSQGRLFLAHAYPTFTFDSVVPFALMLVGFFPVSFSLMIALESFAGEKERNTLEALLSTPLSDRALYLGKLLASLLPPLLASYASMGLYLLGVVAVTGYRPDAAVLGALALVNLGQALVMVAAALIVSSHTTSVRAANLLAAFIILPMSVFIQGSNALVLWGGAGLLWLVALALIVFAALLIRLGLRLFNREQILAREMDDLRPRQLPPVFRQLWRLPPRAALAFRRPAAPLAAPAPPLTWRRLYRADIPALLRLRWPELTIALVTLTVAFLLGWAHAAGHPMILGEGITAGPRALLSGHPQGGAGWGAGLAIGLVSTVLRVVLLGGFLVVLGVISFGALPALFMMGISGSAGFLLGQVIARGAEITPVGVALLAASFALPALALLLLTAFAMRFGIAVAAPPPGFSLGDSLLLALGEYCKVALLAAPLLLLGQVVQTALAALFGAGPG